MSKHHIEREVQGSLVSLEVMQQRVRWSGLVWPLPRVVFSQRSLFPADDDFVALWCSVAVAFPELVPGLQPGYCWYLGTASVLIETIT